VQDKFRVALWHLKQAQTIFKFDFAGYLCCQYRSNTRPITIMIFGSLVCLSGIILTAIDPEPGHKPSAIGAPTDHSGQVAIGGVLLVVGVALFIVGGVLFRQLKKLKDSFPQLPVTFRQTTTRTVSSLVNPLYVEETQATIHPITTVDQTSKANFQQPVYAPTATNYTAQLVGMYSYHPPPYHPETAQQMPAPYPTEVQQSQGFASPASPPSYEECVEKL